MRIAASAGNGVRGGMAPLGEIFAGCFGSTDDAGPSTPSRPPPPVSLVSETEQVAFDEQQHRGELDAAFIESLREEALRLLDSDDGEWAPASRAGGVFVQTRPVASGPRGVLLTRARGLVHETPGRTFDAVRTDAALLWHFYVGEGRAIVSLGDIVPASTSAWTRKNDVTFIRVPGIACGALAPRELVCLSLEGEDLLIVKSVEHPLATREGGAVRARVTFAARAVYWRDASGTMRTAGDRVCELQLVGRVAPGGGLPAAAANYVNVHQLPQAVFARVKERVRREHGANDR